MMNRFICTALAAIGFKPAAEVNLGMGLSAIMAGMRGVGGFPGPFEDGQLRVAAMNHNPAGRMFAFFAANLTSINRVNHGRPLFFYCIRSSCRGCMNNFRPGAVQTVTQPRIEGSLDVEVDETATGKSQNDAAGNREPGMQEVKPEEGDGDCGGDEWVKEVDGIGSIGAEEDDAGDAGEEVLQRSYGIDEEESGYSFGQGVKTAWRLPWTDQSDRAEAEQENRRNARKVLAGQTESGNDHAVKEQEHAGIQIEGDGRPVGAAQESTKG